MPFGKFCGRTITEVYREQPSYLAWFLDAVEADSEEVRAIKAEIEKLPGSQQHLEKYRGQQLKEQWAQRSRFSLSRGWSSSKWDASRTAGRRGSRRNS